MVSVDIKQLKDIVITAAKEELQPRFANVKRRHKADGSIVTEADLVMQERIARDLEKQWPGVMFLGEEMTTDEQADVLSRADSAWCLDPVDGTSNFAAGIPYFGVSLALLEQGQVTAGIVYDPLRDECFSALRGQGATLNEQSLVSTDTGLTLNQSIGLIDFKRLPNELSMRLINETPYASQRSFGSVALDLCWIAAGRCHVCLHGRHNLWDYAAGHLILDEAGGYSTTLLDETVSSNSLEPRSTVAALDKRLFDEWTQWLGVQSDP